ncbi:hypothetical protein L210DRAFT_2472613 [Boletus edulis BED1]|uniref:Uncharacterized protein n=1 Tax=Boletus edulis BED1 TaxID=1328754 RepID=A0AAD4BBG7_BOLED|nr:hypothetical protein L210DRAFT_2472613 [Boletus edulis BED1]
MPLLLNVLRNANDPSNHKLRVKAMEIAVGCDVFRPDAQPLVDALINIQSRTAFTYFRRPDGALTLFPP